MGKWPLFSTTMRCTLFSLCTNRCFTKKSISAEEIMPSASPSMTKVCVCCCGSFFCLFALTKKVRAPRYFCNHFRYLHQFIFSWCFQLTAQRLHHCSASNYFILAKDQFFNPLFSLTACCFCSLPFRCQSNFAALSNESSGH